jgi:hypothetical protein
MEEAGCRLRSAGDSQLSIVNAVVVVNDSAAKHDYFVTLQFHL